MLRIAFLCAALAVLVVPSVASARPSVAKFTATFEAKRVVEWDQPRGVNLIDCKGEHFLETHGSETWELKTARPQKLLVQGGVARGMTLWRFGTWNQASLSPQTGLEVKGPRVRDLTTSSGTTGGWCLPGFTVDPQREDDCGTRLTEQVVHFSNMAGVALWTHTQAPWTRRENVGYDTCFLLPPDGVSEGEFPKLTKKLGAGTLFNRRQKKIVVSASKTFGPDAEPVPNYGVDRTRKATVTWKLTLVRK